METSDKISLLAEIYAKQEVLNGRVLAKLDISYDEIMCNAQGDCPGLAPTWIENYRKAFSAEFAEYLDSERGTANEKVEVVDMLHFLVSLSQIVGIPPYVAVDCIDHTSHLNGTELVRGTFLTLDRLQNACKWKWWADGGGFDLDKAKFSIEDLWSFFSVIMGAAGLSWGRMYDLYMKKNQVNHDRQDQHYNEDTKTEADNESLAPDAAIVLSVDYHQVIDYEAECALSPDGEKPKSSEMCDAGETYGNMLYQPTYGRSSITTSSWDRFWPAVYPLEDDDE